MKTKFSQKELKLLSTNRAIKHLLTSDPMDVEETLKHLKSSEELADLQAELIDIQNLVVENNMRVMILFEGREFAGKGRSITAFTEHLNPRNIRSVALRKPNDNHRAQWYFKRYVERLPEQGEIVFFDRSWYNRAVIEPVNDFCSKDEYLQFMKEVNHFERLLIDDGIHLIKFYLDISKEVQIERIEEVKNNPLERWQLSKVDLEAVDKWNYYSRYTNKMLKKTNGKKNPWQVIDADDIEKAVLDQIKMVVSYFEQIKK